MMVYMRRSRRQLCDADIVEAESALGLEFPTVYREFLLTHNGGRPRTCTFPIADNPSDSHSMVDFFFYLKDSGTYNLLRWARRLKGRVPAELLPIAIDPGGNLICLAVSGCDLGQVCFWDHEEEADEGKAPTYDNIYAVADSFDQFLGSLTE